MDALAKGFKETGSMILVSLQKVFLFWIISQSQFMMYLFRVHEFSHFQDIPQMVTQTKRDKVSVEMAEIAMNSVERTKAALMVCTFRFPMLPLMMKIPIFSSSVIKLELHFFQKHMDAASEEMRQVMLSM